MMIRGEVKIKAYYELQQIDVQVKIEYYGNYHCKVIKFDELFSHEFEAVAFVEMFIRSLKEYYLKYIFR